MGSHLRDCSYFFVAFYLKYVTINSVTNMDEKFERLVAFLKEKNLKIAAAESCTAGLFSARLAGVPGASSVLEFGFVVYSEKAKHKVLGVPFETIEKYGVVSPETAEAMAKGARETSGSDVGIGITGFAGPASDGVLPVGRVCFGFDINGEIYACYKDFGSVGRNEVRSRAADFAAAQLTALLEKTK